VGIAHGFELCVHVNEVGVEYFFILDCFIPETAAVDFLGIVGVTLTAFGEELIIVV